MAAKIDQDIAKGVAGTPKIRPVGDSGVLVEFGSRIDDDIHRRVLALDAVIKTADIIGLTESIPAYTSLLIGYDPIQTDFESIKSLALSSLTVDEKIFFTGRSWEIPTCYSAKYAPDLPILAEKLQISPEEIIAQHGSAIYKVYLYGFAPGFAYLGGVPDAIQVERKPSPVDNVPTGSVIIAGPQALITTVVMPSGWWVIGRTLQTPLQSQDKKPFLFDVGDSVKFVPLSEAEFDAAAANNKN